MTAERGRVAMMMWLPIWQSCAMWVIGHDQVVVAHSSASTALYRAAVMVDKLSDRVMVTDLQACWFARVGDVPCGAMPIEAKGKKLLSRQFSLGPSIATCETKRPALAKLDLGADHANKAPIFMTDVSCFSEQ